MMDNVNVNALNFEASVIDGPTINSRAGLYVYINAMVCIRLPCYMMLARLTFLACRASFG